MIDRENVIKGLEDAQVMLTEAVDRGGEMAVMSAFNCLNNVTRAIALLKEQDELVRCKYCERRETYQCPVHVGYSDDGYDEPDDWFCADGERRCVN